MAITLSGAGAGALLRASDGTQVTTATGQGALSALAELGVSVEPQYRAPWCSPIATPYLGSSSWHARPIQHLPPPGRQQ